MPGVVAATSFAGMLLDRLRADPVGFIALPPGRSVSDAARQTQEAADYTYRVVMLGVDSTTRRNSFCASLGNALALDGNAEDVEQLLRAMHVLHQPRLICCVPDGVSSQFSDLIETHRLIAAATRDTPAPIRFLWLLPSEALGTLPWVNIEVWPPDPPIAVMPNLASDKESAVQQVLDLYAGLRIYWEASGQPDLIRQCTEAVETAGVLASASAQIDEALDRTFNEIRPPAHVLKVIGEYALGSMRSKFSEALQSPQGAGLSMDDYREWRSRGLTWEPPGQVLWRMTVHAVRATTDEQWLLRWYRDQAESVARVHRVRMNPFICNLVLGLTAEIEERLLTAIRQVDSWDRWLSAEAELDELTRLREKGRCLGVSYFSSDSLLDYASLGKLVSIANGARRHFRFPLSIDMLRRIADIRNFAAHGKPVRWDAIRQLVVAVLALRQ